MNIHFKITFQHMDQIRKDLQRPHPFADERVGFLYVGRGDDGQGGIVLMGCEYFPVRDDHYVPDCTVGAKIGQEAIREAMQKTLDIRKGAFHVHMHGLKGSPGVSKTDRQSLFKLMPSFHNVAPGFPHGLIILSIDSLLGRVWLNKEDMFSISKVTVVGFPMDIRQGGIYA